MSIAHRFRRAVAAFRDESRAVVTVTIPKPLGQADIEDMADLALGRDPTDLARSRALKFNQVALVDPDPNCRVIAIEPTSVEGIKAGLHQIQNPLEVAARLQSITDLQVAMLAIIRDDLRECANHLRRWYNANVIPKPLVAPEVAPLEDTDWKRHSEFHRSRIVMGKRLNVWTDAKGTMSAQYNDKMHYGAEVLSLVKSLAVTL